jgi:VCBS repeat-containing protein
MARQMKGMKRLCLTLPIILALSLVNSSGANALTGAEATTRLNSCIAAINDPLYTRSTLPGIMGFASITTLENAIAAGTLVVYIANGAGVIPNSASANGNAQDLFCGDSNNNQIPTMDSDASTQDFFFGGAGDDSLTGTMWFSKFYGGPGNDYANSIQERSTFDGGPGNDTLTTLSPDSIFIQGTDDSTPPTFPSAESFSVTENVTSVGTISTNENATISIFGGVDQAKFNLTKTTDTAATLAFSTAQNFEIPTDADTNNTYIVVFRALDAASNAGYETVTVTVTNVNEAPSISTNSSLATHAISQAENNSAVTTYSGTDVDAGSSLAWSISGTDAADFSINSSSGVLAFALNPDFEAPLDSDTNNSYVLIVTLSDGSLTDTQTVTISITNANESAQISTPTVSSDVNKGVTKTVTVTLSVAGKVRFFVGEKRISGCLSRTTSGSYPNFTATCSWKPPVSGRQFLTATVTPTDNTFSGSTSARGEVFVLKRTGAR